METTMSPRKQIQIPGTERKEYPEVEEAAQRVRDRARRALRAQQARARRRSSSCSHVKRAQGRRVQVLRRQGRGGRRSRIDEGEPKVTVRKTGEAEPRSARVCRAARRRRAGGHEGAHRRGNEGAADAGVEETNDGDVVVPDTAAPKAKKKKGSKKS
jgi:hypothetical protein